MGSTIKGDKKFSIPNNILIFFIFIFLQSAIFSVSKLDSFIKELILLGTSVYALSLVKRYDFRQILTLGIWGSFIITIVTSIFIFIDKNHAWELYKEKQVLSGTFPNKNNLATYMLFSILICISYLRNYYNHSQILKFITLTTLTLSLIFLVKSGSATSITTFIVILTIYCVQKLFRNKLNVVWIGLTLNLLVFFIIKLQGVFEKYILMFSSRDLTLTGRTYIWDAIISQTGSGLFWGYGYGTFWGYQTELEQSIISKYTGYIGGVIVNGSHNGFLELLLQIGTIGTLLFTIILIQSGKRIKYIKDKSFQHFSFFFYMYILLYFITERSFWNMGYQTLFLFVILITSFKRQKY